MYNTTDLEIIEGALGSDAVDEDEALTILHVEISHGSELFLEHQILFFRRFWSQ